MSTTRARIIAYSLVSGMLSLSAACVSTSVNDGAGAGSSSLQAAPGAGIQDYVLVDCLLPGQIRRLGTSMTYLTPRRSVKATQQDCAIRGGEYVLFDRSDYGSALQVLLPKARAGDVVAQTYVGEIYEKGLGIAGPDYAEAASWYRKAAENNHGPAQTSLGSLYERGLGVPKDKAAALDWYRRATGLSEDRLIFESQLKAERDAFNREIALRNQVASSLRQRLQQARQRSAQAPAAGTTKVAAAPDTAALERLMESQRRDAQREAELKAKELHAVQELKASEASTGAGKGVDGKAAQAGKLELSLRQQYDGLLDTSRRLVASK